MATAIPANSVWSAMTYTPPRGRCNYKQSLLNAGCPCLRFMLHPVKAATSFECDGCSHHASFHSLENPAEDAVLKKWEAQESEQRRERVQQAIAGAEAGVAKKRKRVKERAEEDEVRIVEVVDVADEGIGEGMLERTMALFSSGGLSDASVPIPASERDSSTRPKRTARGKKG